MKDNQVQNAAKLLGARGGNKRWAKTSATRRKEFMQRVRAAKGLYKKPKGPTFSWRAKEREFGRPDYANL
jgi:hypothetical protein